MSSWQRAWHRNRSSWVNVRLPGLRTSSRPGCVSCKRAASGWARERQTGVRPLQRRRRHRGAAIVNDYLPDPAVIEATTAALLRKEARERRRNGDTDPFDRRADQRPRARLISRRGDEITPAPINWLWPGRIARGTLTVVAGHPGTGKSQVTSAIVATVTRAGQWPVDRTRARSDPLSFCPPRTMRPTRSCHA